LPIKKGNKILHLALDSNVILPYSKGISNKTLPLEVKIMQRNWLLEIRKSRGYTHAQVAKEAGIKRQYFGMIESGKSNPSVEVAKRIASVLGFEWTLFFEKEGNETLRDNKPAAHKAETA
jgi:DNA-binding XRE family transcriptional regulator